MAEAARPTFYFDYSSVYAYLAATRLDDVLPVEPEWHPVWLPAVFAATGRESWFFSDRRDEGVAEVVRRAERYGVPFARHDELMEKLVPRGSLLAQRAGIVAKEAGRLVPYSREVLTRFCGHGEDITDPAMVAAAATVAVGDRLFWGDDRLEEAAAALGG